MTDKIEFKLTYDSLYEAEEAFDRYKAQLAAQRVLANLRNEMRAVCKHGDPTDRDTFWYSRLFELAGQEDAGGWDF